MGPQPSRTWLIKEIDDVLAQHQEHEIQDRRDIQQGRDQAARTGPSGSPDPPASSEFLKLAPKDARAVRLLYTAASMTPTSTAKTALQDRIHQGISGFDVRGNDPRRRDASLNRIGKPFDLEFTDAIKGSTVSIKKPQGQGRRHRLLGHLVRAVRRRDAAR